MSTVYTTQSGNMSHQPKQTKTALGAHLSAASWHHWNGTWIELHRHPIALKGCISVAKVLPVEYYEYKGSYSSGCGRSWWPKENIFNRLIPSTLFLCINYQVWSCVSLRGSLKDNRADCCPGYLGHLVKTIRIKMQRCSWSTVKWTVKRT